MKRKIFLVLIVSLLLTKCSEQRNHVNNDISIGSHTIDNNNKLVYFVKNNSKNDVFILNLKHEINPDVYEKREVDSIWRSISFPFYNSLSILLDTSEIFQPHHDQMLKYNPDKNRPEVYYFYNKVIDRIKGSSLSMKPDLMWEFDELICNSVFLKQGESYFDTIGFFPYRIMHPENELKFIFSYPKIYLQGIEISYLNFYVKDILSDSLGITFPRRLDGYEVVYNELFRHEILINAVN